MHPEPQPSEETEGVSSMQCPECSSDLPLGARFCPSCGEEIGPATGVPSSEIRKLQAEIMELREVMNHNGDIVDEIAAVLHSSNIFSDSFWQRAWAVWGHAIVPGLIIGGCGYLVMALLIGASL